VFAALKLQKRKRRRSSKKFKKVTQTMKKLQIRLAPFRTNLKRFKHLKILKRVKTVRMFHKLNLSTLKLTKHVIVLSKYWQTEGPKLKKRKKLKTLSKPRTHRNFH